MDYEMNVFHARVRVKHQYSAYITYTEMRQNFSGVEDFNPFPRIFYGLFLFFILREKNKTNW